MFTVGKKSACQAENTSSIFLSPELSTAQFFFNMKYRGLETKMTMLKQCDENIKALGPDHMDTRTSFQPTNIHA